ncbi:carbohydrate porin [Roseomonas sp. GCM10028921]
MLPTAAFVTGLLLAAAPASAQPDPLGPMPPGAEQPAAPETSDDPSEVSTTPSIADSFPDPDPGRIRASLGERGITYSSTYIGETLGNVSGGIKQSRTYQGRLDMQIDMDFEKLAGLRGLSFHANAYQIHGRGLSGCCLGNLLVTSGIEAQASTRLYELWVEQKLWGDRLSLRVGQLAADTEFFVSRYATLFVNGTFGWPAFAAANLPAGGPAYPFAAPGARLKVEPAEGVALLAAVFNGDPAGPGADPQRGNPSGTNFRTSDPAFVLAEVSYAYNQGREAASLPGAVKLGGYHHFGRFEDPRVDASGLSLNDPNGSGTPRRLRGSRGMYVVLDQLVHREAGTRDQGLGVFLRAAGSPSGGSLVDIYADAGVTYKGLFAGRVNDTLGLGFAYAHISGPARGFDRDVNSFGPTAWPVRSSEAVVELSYQAEVVPGFTVQPTFQYVVRPGGHAANPRDPDGRAIRDAAVLGVRATVRY